MFPKPLTEESYQFGNRYENERKTKEVQRLNGHSAAGCVISLIRKFSNSFFSRIELCNEGLLDCNKLPGFHENKPPCLFNFFFTWSLGQLWLST